MCDGCEDDNYFDPGVGANGGCIECSPACSIVEIEIRSCTTDHDRECKPKGLATLPNPGKFIYFPNYDSTELYHSLLG